MTFEEWQTRFYGALLTFIGGAIGGTMNVTSSGYVFGGYVISVKLKGKDDCIVWAVEDVGGSSGSVDAMKWYANLQSGDPEDIASEVADWLRPRVKQRG